MITSDFEGFEDSQLNGNRFVILGSNWKSSFGEFISTIIGKKIIDVQDNADAIYLILEDNIMIQINNNQILFGHKRVFIVLRVFSCKNICKPCQPNCKCMGCHMPAIC